MKRSMNGLGLALAGAFGLVGLVGCTVGGDADRRDDALGDDGGVSPVPSNQAMEGAPDSGRSSMSFKPSNLALSSSSTVEDVEITKPCELDTDKGTIDCITRSSSFAFAKTEQGSGAGLVAVFTMRSLRVQPSATLRVKGSLPLVLFTATTMDIQGGLDASSNLAGGHAGGFLSAENGAGGGPGGGGSGSSSYNAGAGGTYCGAGGAGGVNLAPGALPTAAYGSSELVPLVGGSSGGGAPGSLGGRGGAGGGAVQLVAGTSINIGIGGFVNVGGGGGTANGGAGGSGGTLLIESPRVNMLGKLAANGGGGTVFNGGASGQNGLPTSTRAQGTAETAGTGSGASIDGTSGTKTAGDPNSSGSGGGGAGRIRINTESGVATISGVVSPALATPCVTQGKLQM
jgi:hypothetical protein